MPRGSGGPASAYKRKRQSSDSKELEALEDCFPRSGGEGRRSCVYCDEGNYNASTSTANLRYHLHEKHANKAIELGIRPDKRHLPSPPSVSALAASSSSSIDLTTDLAAPSQSLPPVPFFYSLSHSSSSSIPSSPSSVSQFSFDSQPHRILTSPHPSISSSGSRKQRKIDQYGTLSSASNLRLSTAKAIDAQVDLWLYEGLAYLLADSKYLRHWLTLFRQGSGEVAGRKQIALRAPARAAEVMNRVKHLLRQSSGVTVGIDGWTNVNGAKVINFCPVARGTAFYFHSAVLKDFSTAAAQHIPVRDGLRAIMAAGIPVMCAAAIADDIV